MSAAGPADVRTGVGQGNRCPFDRGRVMGKTQGRWGSHTNLVMLRSSPRISLILLTACVCPACFSRESPACSLRGTCWWAGVASALEQEKPEARKILENAADSPASCGRVKGWRHNLGVADPLLSVSCESASVPSPCLVSIPCHIEPDMRFSLIRLSDNLLPAAFKV